MKDGLTSIIIVGGHNHATERRDTAFGQYCAMPGHEQFIERCCKAPAAA